MLSTPIDNKRKVLEATDIVRLIGDHLALKPKGREYVALCPFHDDHSPSMFVVPAKQIFHCFSCGAGGNAIDFAMRYHAMDFRGALEFLAERSGVVLERFTPVGPARDAAGASSESTKDELLRANAFALGVFRVLLNHPDHGKPARDTIARRGIAPEMVEAFQIGTSPDRWDGLLKTIESKGLDLRPFAEAGLLKSRENSGGGGGHYDALRNRLVFPIFDQIGRVVGFGGRRLNDEDEPKYLNSPESRVFDKGSTLFGLHQAQRAIQNARTAVVTEGYTDAIACHQHGFAHTVATLGTALTTRHAALLRRLADRVVLLFDGDDAGLKAADRALEVVFAEPIDIRVAVLPGGDDPDDLLKQPDGPARFRGVLDSAQDFLEFRFARLRQRFDETGLTPGSNARARAIEDEIDRLVQLGLRRLSPLRQQTVLGRLTALAGVDASTVVEALRRAGLGPGSRSPRGEQGSPPSIGRPRRSPSDEALGCLLNDPTLAVTDPDGLDDILREGAYGSPLSEVAGALAAALDSNRPPSLDTVLDILTDAPARSAAAALALEVDRRAGGDHATIARHWTECIRRFRLDRARQTTLLPPPLPGSETSSDLDHLTQALQRRRNQHAELGGDPLALPRPRALPT